MFGWTRLVLATAWVMSASLACAGATPRPSTPDSVRSPPLDYADGPRSTNDGDVMGAHGAWTQDWLSGSATTDHLGPGWSFHDGRAHFEREATSAAAGVGSQTAPACPPRSAALAPDEAREHTALRRAWLESVREPMLPAIASAVADASADRSGFLSCDRR